MGCGSRGWIWGGLLGGCGFPGPYPDHHHHGHGDYPPYDTPTRDEPTALPPATKAEPARPEAARAGGGGGTRGTAPDVTRGIEDLKRKQADALQAEEESRKLIEELRRAALRLQDEVARYESLAKGAVSLDETQARVYLQRRQAAAEQAASLETRIKELERDVERLQALKMELEARVLDLTAVGQRDRLARLEGEIKGLQP